MAPPTTTTPLFRSAFTLIELIVVIALLGVVAGLTGPRLLSVGTRRAEDQARTIANLLSVAAHRDAMGGERLGLEFESREKLLRLNVFRAPGASTGGGSVEWRADPLVAPASFEGLVLRSATYGGERLDAASWRIEFPEHEPRGTIELVIEEDAGKPTPRRWSIILLAGAAEAVLGAPDASLAPIDLDAAGRGVQTW